MLRLTVAFPIAAIFASTACSGGATALSPAQPEGYAKEWSGATLQGDSITFSVSAQHKVTAITISYNLNGCSGSRSVSGLSLDIETLARPPGNPSVGPFDNPRFQYASENTGQANFFSVTGAFTSSDTATGVTAFSNFIGCGNGVAAWNAHRR